MCGFIITCAMDASKIHHRNRINTADSLSIGHLPQFCSDICSKTTKSFVRIHRRVKFAVNLQIFSLAKCYILQGQKSVKDCNMELMSDLSSGCINFEEAMLGCGREQKESALISSANEIHQIRQEFSHDSSKHCKSEIDTICSSLCSAVGRISFLDHLRSFSEPRISYSDLLRMFCQNLSRAFNHNQNHLTGHYFHQPRDLVPAAKLGDHLHSMCAVTADEAVSDNSRNAFSFNFCKDHSERNTDELMQSEATNIHAALKAGCAETESFATDSVYSNSSSCHFHLNLADKSGTVAARENSSYLDKNLSDFEPSPLSTDDTIIAMANSSDKFVSSCSSRTQPTATCDKKASRHRRRHRQLRSVQQYSDWRSHKLCRKQNHRQSKSTAKLQPKSRPPKQVAGSHHSSVGSDNTCTDEIYLMKADTIIMHKKNIVDMNQFRDCAKDMNCATGRHTCLEIINYETNDNIDDVDLTDGIYCSVIDDEANDEVTDDETTDEEETDEDVLADDESNDANSWDDEISDEKSDEEGELQLKGKATAFGCSISDKANPTSTNVQTFCKSSFFFSPSEIDSSDSSSNSDDEDDEDNDLEVDGSVLCESFSFNGLYFPSSCSPVETNLSLEELKQSDRTRGGDPSVSALDCSCFDNSCDDIVFCDDQESLSCPSDDEEDLPLTNLSHMQSINARWNHFYSAPREAEELSQNKKQVRFARDSSLVTTYAEAMSEAEDYAAARKGPWEEYARDRDRFTRRIRDTAEQISWVLSPCHRSQVYRNSFSKH